MCVLCAKNLLFWAFQENHQSILDVRCQIYCLLKGKIMQQLHILVKHQGFGSFRKVLVFWSENLLHTPLTFINNGALNEPSIVFLFCLWSAHVSSVFEILTCGPTISSKSEKVVPKGCVASRSRGGSPGAQVAPESGDSPRGTDKQTDSNKQTKKLSRLGNRIFANNW